MAINFLNFSNVATHVLSKMTLDPVILRFITYEILEKHLIVVNSSY